MKRQWTQAIAVGIEEIDNQHKKFIEVFNDLLDAMAAAKSKEKIGEVIIFLEEYADSHFSLEQRYMLDYYYQDYDEHKKKHDEFRNKVEKFKNDIGTNTNYLRVVLETEKELYRWLIDHIEHIDVKMGKFLKEKMPKK